MHSKMIGLRFDSAVRIMSVQCFQMYVHLSILRRTKCASGLNPGEVTGKKGCDGVGRHPRRLRPRGGWRYLGHAQSADPRPEKIF